MMKTQTWIRFIIFGLGMIILAAGISLFLRRFPINRSVSAVRLSAENQTATSVPDNSGNQPMTWATNDAKKLSSLLTSAPEKAAWILEGTRRASMPQAVEPILPTHTAAPYPEYPGVFRRPAGAGTIVENPRRPYRAAMHVAIFNSWVEKKADRYLLVMAGQDFSNELHYENKIWIDELSSDGDHPPLDSSVYPLPIQNREDFPIYIVDAVGEKVILRSEIGSNFVFDVATRQFISGDGLLPAKWATGGGTLIEDGQVPFSRPGFFCFNRWSVQRGNQTVTVYAGADIEDRRKDLGHISKKPLFAVVTSTVEPTASDPVDFYPLLAPSDWPEGNLGIANIVSVQGDQVLFTGVGGPQIFDLSTRNYLPYARAYPGFDFGPSFDDLPTMPATTPIYTPTSTPTSTASPTPEPSPVETP